MLFCDNTTVVQLLRKGTSCLPLLMAELRQVWHLLIDMQVDLVPVYIPSGDNPVRAGVRPFPEHLSHVLCYLGYLQEEDAVKAGSLQQYLSAINSWHADMGLSKPAVGQAVNMLCRGYSEVQGD